MPTPTVYDYFEVVKISACAAVPTDCEKVAWRGQNCQAQLCVCGSSGSAGTRHWRLSVRAETAYLDVLENRATLIRPSNARQAQAKSCAKWAPVPGFGLG